MGEQDLPAAFASLRAAFADEVASRLPRLEALRAGDSEVSEDARRDAHSLASSGVIVGEPEIARLAREVELHLADGPLEELLSALRGFTP